MASALWGRNAEGLSWRQQCVGRGCSPGSGRAPRTKHRRTGTKSARVSVRSTGISELSEQEEAGGKQGRPSEGGGKGGGGCGETRVGRKCQEGGHQ